MGRYHKRFSSFDRFPKPMAMRLTLFLLVLCLSYTGQCQLPQYFTDVLNCASAEEAGCEELLHKAISKSQKENSYEVHFKNLTRTADKLIRLGKFDLSRQVIYHGKAISQGKPKRLGELYFILNANFLYAGNLDSALYYGGKARDVFTEIKDTGRVGRATINMGQILKEKGNYTEAMEKYMEGISIFRKLGDKDLIARAQVEVASLSAVTGDVAKAIRYNKKAARHYEESDDDHNFAYTTLNLANDLIFTGKPDTALLLLEKVIPIFKRDDETYLWMNAEAQYGRALHRLGQSTEAIKHFELSNSLGQGQSFLSQLAYNYEFLSRIYLDIEKPEMAINYSKQSYHIHKQLGLNEEYKSAANSLAEAYEYGNMPDSALKYLREATAVGDSIFSQETKRRLNELKVKYESDIKEEQIKAGQAEIETLNQKNRAQKNRTVALGLGLGLLLVLGGGIISRQRTRMLHNRRIAAEQAKTLQAQLNLKTQEEKRLKAELDYKKRELTTQALMIAEKNEMMLSFKERLQEISERMEEDGAMNQLVRNIERAENQTQDWDKFMEIFREVHPDFLSQMNDRFDNLTSNDLRLLALIKMNFSNKEIASILHISDDGLKKARYRLRKKLDLPSEENMHDYIIGL